MFHLSGTLDVEKGFSGEAARKFGFFPEQFLHGGSHIIDTSHMTQCRDKMSVSRIMAVGDEYRLVGPFCGCLMLFHEQMRHRSIR